MRDLRKSLHVPDGERPCLVVVPPKAPGGRPERAEVAMGKPRLAVKFLESGNLVCEGLPRPRRIGEDRREGELASVGQPRAKRQRYAIEARSGQLIGMTGHFRRRDGEEVPSVPHQILARLFGNFGFRSYSATPGDESGTGVAAVPGSCGAGAVKIYISRHRISVFPSITVTFP